jgi:hypothetical protein
MPVRLDFGDKQLRTVGGIFSNEAGKNSGVNLGDTTPSFSMKARWIV